MQTNALFTEYLNVVNQTMGAHRDEQPWKTLLKLGDKMLSDKEIGVAIFKNDPSEPHHYATVKFADGSFDLMGHGKEPVDIDWKLSRDHLEDVVEHPQTYIDNPAKLDMAWLKNRVGIA